MRTKTQNTERDFNTETYSKERDSKYKQKLKRRTETQNTKYEQIENTDGTQNTGRASRYKKTSEDSKTVPTFTNSRNTGKQTNTLGLQRHKQRPKMQTKIHNTEKRILLDYRKTETQNADKDSKHRMTNKYSRITEKQRDTQNAKI